MSLTCGYADPVIKIAIEPKSKGDLEKMSNGLIKLAQEDPSFNFSRDEETNQTVIEGMGELHLDIIVDRLRREFKVRLRPSCRALLLAQPRRQGITSDLAGPHSAPVSMHEVMQRGLIAQTRGLGII